jgi:hypothetical protein
MKAFILRPAFFCQKARGATVTPSDKPYPRKGYLVECGEMVDNQFEEQTGRALLSHLQQQRLNTFVCKMKCFHFDH